MISAVSIHFIYSTPGSGIASFASFCLVGNQSRDSFSIAYTIQAIHDAPINHNKELSILGQTIVLDADEDDLPTMLADVLSNCHESTKIQSIFTINTSKKWTGEEFHMNITDDNVIDAAAVIFAMYSTKTYDASEEHMQLAELLCAHMKSRQVYKSLLFFGLNIQDFFGKSVLTGNFIRNRLTLSVCSTLRSLSTCPDRQEKPHFVAMQYGLFKC